LNACIPGNFDPDPDGGFTVTFRDVPEAITDGDTREEALLRAEDALESALAMYIAAKELLPVPSNAEAGEEIVPLSALGMAKTALYDATREQDVGRAVGYAGTCRKSTACSTRVTPRGWNTWRRRSPRSACASSST
jgi:predicted RNase H-like HicB family nuclease